MKCIRDNPKRDIKLHLLVNIEETFAELQLNLFQQQNIEFDLRMSLKNYERHIIDLEERLEKEKQRNERLVKLMRSVDSSPEITTRSKYSSRSSVNHIADDTICSVSPVLMQYRYDELSLSHKKCLRRLAKKEKQVKEEICAKEMILKKYDDLISKYKTINTQTEEVCLMYINTKASKDREIKELKTQLENALECIRNGTKPNLNEKTLKK